MSQTTIPLQFEAYLQQQITAGLPPDMNEVIFAYLPGLDLSAAIDRTQGLPDPATWVYQQDVDQIGKVGESAVAYSVVVDSRVPAFTFNAIYLHDKNKADSCGVIVYKIEETKEYGMSSTKTLLQSYSGAADIAAITLDAKTWQIDFQARLMGIDEQHRLSCLDQYGHEAFISGLTVTKKSTAHYDVAAGVAYVGGLRAVLSNAVIQTITEVPTTIYLDVYQDDSTLSQRVNHVSLFTASTSKTTYKTTYIDDADKTHYVTKVATINADGSIDDERVLGYNAHEVLNILSERKMNTEGALKGGGALSGDLTLSIKDATTTQKGAVKLSDSLDSNSSATGCTSKAIRMLNEKVNEIKQSSDDQKISFATEAEAEALSADNKALSPLTLVKAFQESNQMLSTSGYQKLPGGMIIQWGEYMSQTFGNQVVLFPIVFPTECTAVMNSIPMGSYNVPSTPERFVAHRLDVIPNTLAQYLAIGF